MSQETGSTQPTDKTTCQRHFVREPGAFWDAIATLVSNQRYACSN